MSNDTAKLIQCRKVSRSKCMPVFLNGDVVETNGNIDGKFSIFVCSHHFVVRAYYLYSIYLQYDICYREIGVFIFHYANDLKGRDVQKIQSIGRLGTVSDKDRS